jgi:hypothetical protein
MKRTLWLACAGAGVLLAARVFAADDAQARGALERARNRQRELPGYVEHVFGHFTEMPGAAQTLTKIVTDRLKQEALDRVRDKVALATAKVPVASVVADRVMIRIADRASQEVVETLGPEREILTVQHSGSLVREVFANGYYEVVQTEDRKAIRFNLDSQIAALKAQAAVDLTETGLAEIKSGRTSLKEISASLAHGGPDGILDAAVTIFDQVRELLQTARGTKDLIQAIAALEHFSGTWQCEPTPLEATYPRKSTSVEQLADETIAGVPMHVYRETYNFSTPGKLSAAAAGDDASPAGSYQLQSRTWVRISDGLPVRVEFVRPGAYTQRRDYDYPAKVEIVLPPCLTAP